MKYLFIILCMIAVTSCQNQNQSSTSQEDLGLLRTLKEVHWPKAYRMQDTVLLDKILGSDFVMIDADGNWTDKQAELDWIKNNTYGADSFHYEIKRLEILENGTAIIAGTGHIFNDATETIYQSSNYLIKRNGEWKAFASHVSGVR